MAIYHASTKPISRSAGRSSVAAAAYRSGSAMLDQRTGLIHDYTRRSGVASADVITADGETIDRAALWNAAEAAERRKDARTAREWIIALPSELDAEQRHELALSFGAALARRSGVAVDVCVHQPDREGDNRNHHAHVLTTTRQVTLNGDGAPVMGHKASIELSDSARRKLGLGGAAEEVKEIRKLWEDLANAALERAGLDERIDGRSLQAQGIDREATTHLGPTASEMERRGRASDRGDNNRQVAANNDNRKVLQAEIIALQAQRPKPPKLPPAFHELTEEQQEIGMLALSGEVEIIAGEVTGEAAGRPGKETGATGEISQARSQAIARVRNSDPGRTALAASVRDEFDGLPVSQIEAQRDEAKKAVSEQVNGLVALQYDREHGALYAAGNMRFRAERDFEMANGQLENWRKKHWFRSWLGLDNQPLLKKALTARDELREAVEAEQRLERNHASKTEVFRTNLDRAEKREQALSALHSERMDEESAFAVADPTGPEAVRAAAKVKAAREAAERAVSLAMAKAREDHAKEMAKAEKAKKAPKRPRKSRDRGGFGFGD